MRRSPPRSAFPPWGARHRIVLGALAFLLAPLSAAAAPASGAPGPSATPGSSPAPATSGRAVPRLPEAFRPQTAGVPDEAPLSPVPEREHDGPRDSADVLDDVQGAQARFERARRRHLEVTLAWSGGGCDERVGRMCLRYREGSDWYPDAPEPQEIGVARDELLAELEEAARLLPGDDWIAGQRVVYLGEAGRWADAAEAARACRSATPGWCDALGGLALHGRGLHAEAGAAFRRALAAMDPELAREWRDPEVLLDPAGRGVLDDLTDEAREALWRFADPLLLVPGNDRQTEHWARHVLSRIRDDARNPYRMSWSYDLEELLLRYGPEVGFERTRRAPHDLGDDGVVGHHHPESRTWLPAGSALADPAASAAEDWSPNRRRPRSSYAPPYAPVLLPAESQVAVFPRGERMVVVATHRLPEDTTWHGRHEHPSRGVPHPRWADEPRQAGLFLLPVPESFPGGRSVELPPAPSGTAAEAGVPAVRRVGEEEGVLALEVPAGGWVASVESWDPARAYAGRWRGGVRRDPLPPDVPTLSDLVLLEREVSPDAALEDALAAVRIRPWLSPGEPLVVGWETHGLGWRDEVLGYALSVSRDGANLLVRAGRWLGLLERERPRTLSWTEPGPDAPGPVFRSVALEVPELEPGTYELRLELELAGRSTLAAVRSLEVRAP